MRVLLAASPASRKLSAVTALPAGWRPGGRNACASSIASCHPLRASGRLGDRCGRVGDLSRFDFLFGLTHESCAGCAGCANKRIWRTLPHCILHNCTTAQNMREQGVWGSESAKSDLAILGPLGPQLWACGTARDHHGPPTFFGVPERTSQGLFGHTQFERRPW